MQEDQFSCVSTSADECPVDGDASEPPGAAVAPGSGGRQSASLKSPASPPAAGADERERAKSLPNYGPTNHSSSH